METDFEKCMELLEKYHIKIEVSEPLGSIEIKLLSQVLIFHNETKTFIGTVLIKE